MQLIIVEKPSVAMNVAEALGLGAKQRKDGFFEGNGYYVTFVFGHLFTLYDAKDYNSKYETWDINQLPIIPQEFKYKLLENPGVKKQFAVIRDLARQSECIINGCDSDREGSLIFAEVYAALKTDIPVKRLWVSSHTPEDLREGFEKMKTGAEDEPLTRAGYSRQWADWLFGINFTVATTKMFSMDKTVINVGRVILPTVNLIYQRDMEIKNFKPRKYFELIGTFQATEGVYDGVYVHGDQSQFDDEKGLEPVLRAVTGQPGLIVSVQSKRVSQGSPRLFNLTDLQGFITKSYDGFTAERVLKITQSLYEKRFVTYPRTASRHLDNSQVETARRSLEAVQEFLPKFQFTFKESKSIFDSTKVDSHPAIMPTYLKPKDTDLTPDEKTVYMEIVKRFCAQFMPSAEFDQTEAITEIAGHKFRTKGKVLVNPGWKALYGETMEEEDSVDLKIRLKENTPVRTLEVKAVSKMTKPPAYYTIQTLLEAMQNCGKTVEDETDLIKGFQIGTSATRAEILKKIETVGYVQLQKKSYRITTMGISLVELFPVKEMLNPEFTGRLEKRLKDIERGEYQPEVFLNTVTAMVQSGIELMKQAKGQISKVDPEKITVGKCPECGRDVVEKEKGYGCTGYKENGCRFFIFKENALLLKYGIKTVPKSFARGLLANSLKGTCQLGNKMVPVKLEKSGQGWTLVFDFTTSEIASLGKCPECGKDVVEYEKGYGCMGFKTSGCKFFIWKEDLILKKYGKTVSVKMAKDFLAKRKSLVKGLADPGSTVKYDAEIELYRSDKGFWNFRIIKKAG